MTKQDRVESSHIMAMADSIHYEFERVANTTITGCWAILPNGFKVGYGESSCVEPDNFDKELGEKYAMERAKHDAINRLWELEGYLLKTTGRTSDKPLFKDHEIREFVGELTQLARDYSHTQQLREQLSSLVHKFLRGCNE